VNFRFALCALALALAGATGCVFQVPSYRPMPATPEAFNAERAPSVRVTRGDRSRLTLDAAVLVGDSLVGQASAQTAYGARKRLAVAVTDIRALEVRRTNWPATIAVTGVATAAAVLVAKKVLNSPTAGGWTWR